MAPQQEAKFYDWDQHLADEGFLVLAARVRERGETEAIRKVRIMWFNSISGVVYSTNNFIVLCVLVLREV